MVMRMNDAMLSSIPSRVLQGGVCTDEIIVSDCQSAVIDLATIDSRTLHIHQQIRVNMRHGQLVCNDMPALQWPLLIQVADECRSQNVQCVLVSAQSVMFITIKAIAKNDPLNFWFSETLLAKLEMPFLVPANIQGKDRYVCHKCCAVFPTPNPLKVHLYFDCSPFTLQQLWNRVSQTLARAIAPYSYACCNKQVSHEASVITPAHDMTTTAAHVESLVSHFGRSKQGHVCIYCGKVYSRKYGLKIHIRTHTGYKPLKCPVCLRPFGDPSNLNKHIRLHSDADTPYKCDICGKLLVRKRDLERHWKSRHADSSESLLSQESIKHNSQDDHDDADELIDIC